MRPLMSIPKRALPGATTALRTSITRTYATRTATIDNTLRPRHQIPDHPPAIPLDYDPSLRVYGGAWATHWNNAAYTTPSRPVTAPPSSSRARYSTHIYAGQGGPTAAEIRNSAPPHEVEGPATGAGTGVFVSAQMFGVEVKGNPTESEADVAADRSEEDPLPPERHHKICLGAGGAAPGKTESEEDVCADRGGPDVDPLGQKRSAVRAAGSKGGAVA